MQNLENDPNYIDEKTDFFASVWEDTSQNVQASTYNHDSSLLSDSVPGSGIDMGRDSSETSQVRQNETDMGALVASRTRQMLEPLFEDLRKSLSSQAQTLDNLVVRVSNLEITLASLSDSVSNSVSNAATKSQQVSVRGSLVPLPHSASAISEEADIPPNCRTSTTYATTIRETRLRSEKENEAEIEAKKEAELRRVEEQRLRKEAEERQRADDERQRLEAEKRKEQMEEKRKLIMSTLITGGKGDLFGDAAPKKLGLFDD